MSYDYDEETPRRPSKDRRPRALAEAARLQREGVELTPVSAGKITARALAATFWGRAWCTNLERYSHHASRLARGRSALRLGAVLDLRLSSGRIEAKVYDERLCEVSIRLHPVEDERWQALKERCLGHVESWLDLLQGQLAAPVLEHLVAPEFGLFPEPSELRCSCDCTDEADLCEHAAAALYGVGLRLDTAPEALFVLRQVDAKELIVAAAVPAGEPGSTTLAEANLAALFDLDLV